MTYDKDKEKLLKLCQVVLKTGLVLNGEIVGEQAVYDFATFPGGVEIIDDDTEEVVLHLTKEEDSIG